MPSERCSIPQERRIAAIQNGQSFYGVVDILGKPYMTGYEPMQNSSKQTVGIWYVGFPLTAVGDLGERIGNAKILDHGFVALSARGRKSDFQAAKRYGR